jgi:Cu(I)/Ag(I) efflux system membrane fusion protein/cobalt-zinc-cadmium efflux system membrane fusion protein
MTEERKATDENADVAMPNDSYRRAFFLTLAALIAAVAAAGWLWWRSPLNLVIHRAQQAVTTTSSEPPQTAAQETATADSGAAPSETPLASIQLSPRRMQNIGVRIGTVQAKSINDEIRSYGNVQPDERRFAYVQTHFAGWIRQVYADATGDLVRKGQPLFTIYSPDLIASEREYLVAKKNAVALQNSSVSGVADGAASLIAAAKARLQQFDIADSEIAKLDATGEPINDLTFYSPASGYVTERNALPNMYVQPETKLYSVTDLSDVWVLAQIFQNDAGKVKPGDRAEITLDAYPGRNFKGSVDYLLPQLDAATRTLPVRLVFPNPDLKLRPGMYVNVSLKLPLGQRLVVADSAVFHSGIKNLVFTYSGEGNIQPREVELGPHVGDQFVVTKGLKAGEQIVTSANFLIDSEAQLQAAAGAFAPPPPGAGQAAAMNSPAKTQAIAELTTQPSPPQKGGNTIRVKLTDSTGKPISGAQVSVTFFMPAMPAMGMAAMKTMVQAGDKGGGMYEGSGSLGSGGTWQVTITAVQNGQTIANEQLTVNATGGM